jgi:hypothetical protein
MVWTRIFLDIYAADLLFINIIFMMCIVVLHSLE